MHDEVSFGRVSVECSGTAASPFRRCREPSDAETPRLAAQCACRCCYLYSVCASLHMFSVIIFALGPERNESRVPVKRSSIASDDVLENGNGRRGRQTVVAGRCRRFSVEEEKTTVKSVYLKSIRCRVLRKGSWERYKHKRKFPGGLCSASKQTAQSVCLKKSF